MAEPGIARTGFLLQQVGAEMRAGRSVLMVDFGGDEGHLMAALSKHGRVVLVEADARDGVFPLGGLRVLPASVRAQVAGMFEAWLRPPGHAAESRAVREAVAMLAGLPATLPRTNLFAWRRYLMDRGYRKDVFRQLRREGLDPGPLQAARPGTTLWNLLEGRVDVVLGHDDTLDRVFPFAEPGSIVEPPSTPELRIVHMQAPWSDRASRFHLLVWLQLLAALAARPARRKDGRAHVERVVLIDPPAALWSTAELLPQLEGAPRLTLVSGLTRPPYPRDAWFGGAPALVVQRSLGPDALATVTQVDVRDARRVHAGAAGTELLFVHQLGAPVDRWCGIEAQKNLPGPVPGALSRARAEGRKRHLVDRASVIENRRRIEAHAARSNRRSATADLLTRAVRRERLTEAWRRVHANQGAPGVDAVTVEAFGERWQHHLAALQVEVMEDRYRPHPYLRVWASKPTGGVRGVGIPAVVDRVLMGACADVLAGVLDPTFSDRSFAYRAGRGARDAVASLSASARLQDGWALVADIASYFDNVDHGLLLGMLREQVADDHFVRLVGAWVTNPARDGGVDARPKRGVPQGSPISPVLANLYLTPLDRWMERKGLDYARYADDFVAICDSARDAQVISEELEAFLARELRLAVKPTKTAYVAVAEGFDFLGFRIDAAGPTIPDARVAEARETVEAILLGEGAHADVLKRLDAYVRGFRNYFDLGTARIGQALGELEVARRSALEPWASARHLDAGLVIDRAERFTAAAAPQPPPPGAYHTEAARDHDVDEPPPGLAAPTTSLAVVERRPAAVRARARARRPVAVDAGGHLGIFGAGAAVGMDGERIVLRQKGEIVFEAPLRSFRSVHVDSYGVSVSSQVLEALAARDVPVVLSRPGGAAWAVVRPLVSKGSAELLRAQLLANGSSVGIVIAKELIGAKLVNQERLLRYYAKAKVRRSTPAGSRLREAADMLSGFGTKLLEIDDIDVDAARRRIFSAEGRAGAIYWTALRDVLGEVFPGRTGRGASDPINMALNYGYGVLYAATWAAVARSGLDPAVGMLHASTGDRGALVFDLVEPFRVPAVDRAVVGLVTRGKDLKLNQDGHLTTTTRRHVAAVVGAALQHATPWNGTARPLGEHIDRHAADVAVWIQGGTPMKALRIRW